MNKDKALALKLVDSLLSEEGSIPVQTATHAHTRSFSGVVGREELLDAGWARGGAGTWISPYDGEIMSFEEAREAESAHRSSSSDSE